MRALQLFFAAMMLLAAVCGAAVGIAANAATAHFVRTSPWMILFYSPFAAAMAYGLRK